MRMSKAWNVMCAFAFGVGVAVLPAAGARNAIPADDAPMACPYCDLAGVDLSGKDLRGANLAGADLRGADLSRTRLDGAVFMAARLEGAKLDGAVAEAARGDRSAAWKGPVIFIGANLTSASLVKARLGEAILTYANLTCVDFSGADLRGVIFDPQTYPVDSAGCQARLDQTRLSPEQRLAWSGRLPGLARSLEGAGVSPSSAGGMATSTSERWAYCGSLSTHDLGGNLRYVTPEGADGNDCGAPAKACQTVGRAAESCAAGECHVLVKHGRYALPDPWTLGGREQTQVWGGCGLAEPDPRIHSLVVAPANQPALRMSGGEQGVRFLALQGSEATTGPSVTVEVDHGRGPYTGGHLVVMAGQGSRGDPGERGRSGTPGKKADGATGGTNSDCSECYGGGGGLGSWTQCLFRSYETCGGHDGSAGGAGSTGRSAAGGSQATQPGYAKWTAGGPQGPGNGNPGENGSAGPCKAGGKPASTTTGSWNYDRWEGATGGVGEVGGNGGGGGGGGGGAGYYLLENCDGHSCNIGISTRGLPGGGGGGGGGCGKGGLGGAMGAPSVGLLVRSAAISLEDSVFIGGRGGQGGRGGCGGEGGDSGDGASSTTGNTQNGNGGHGGRGGDGGPGGGGAGGNGGPAFGILLVEDGTFTAPSSVRHHLGASGTPGQGGPVGPRASDPACHTGHGQPGIKGAAAVSHKF